MLPFSHPTHPIVPPHYSITPLEPCVHLHHIHHVYPVTLVEICVEKVSHTCIKFEIPLVVGLGIHVLPYTNGMSRVAKETIISCLV